MALVHSNSWKERGWGVERNFIFGNWVRNVILNMSSNWNFEKFLEWGVKKNF